MNQSEIEAIPNEQKKAVLQYVANTKATYKTKELTARMLGISPAQMYDFLKADWDKISLETFNRLAQNVGVNRTWNIVETTNFKKMRGAFNAAQSLSNMYAILGETGTGKTFAASYLSKKMDNVFYILGDATMTKTSFMDAILTAMNQRAYNYRSASAKMAAICQKLNQTTSPLLVIDDAGKLKETVISLIQIIYDHTSGRSGLLLIGTETLYQKVVKNAENNRFHMREFYGRVGHWDELGYPTESDIKAICEGNGITDETAITWLNNATVSLHTLENMVSKSIEISKATGRPITGELLAQTNNKFRWMDKTFQNFETRLTNKKTA